MKARFIAGTFPFLVSMICWAPRASVGECAAIEIPQVIEIADRTISTIGYDRSTLSLIMIKRYSEPNNELLSGNHSSEYAQRIIKKLEGRQYWCVYYVPNNGDEGGDVGVFIDAKTAEVVDIYRGR